ncbi:2-amino-3,7-dideoxy-D-threo-hept-6-ulosonate synthase [Phytoactinopolyspora limicola]|uniref:2-amino-3,7-dideoxy-D-threo-hept-6-ulosonate synthase n=1 Tax=Phytoactinopolyspora limicola TaxID=2715536 RepID=UPI00140C51E7|nr:2-amino-3,7-dideoxy-D-threo-hept-6-ulosonate synthase [Phytoactinopolyspora limicola]
MVANLTFAKGVRTRRLFHRVSGRIFIVPLDHSITDGPITGGCSLDDLVGRLAGNGVDAVVLHKGSARQVNDAHFAETSFIMHLSASTACAPDPDAKRLVASVEEALRMGADAVSVHLNIGSMDEARQIADVGTVAGACDRWNVPLLAMVYPRGPKIENPRNPDLIAHAATVAADLGADIVKTVYAGSPDVMRDIVDAVPIPVVVAGGPRQADADAILDYVDETLQAGTAGLAMGRNVFQAPSPGLMARRIAQRVHADEVRFVNAAGFENGTR